MKILLATAYDYPHAGGLSTHVTTLKAGLEELGHQVDILSFSDVPAWKRKALAQGPSFILNKFKKGKGIVWSHKMRRKFLYGLIEANKQKGYDLINAQDPFTVLAALATGIPTVATVHGYMTFESISKGSLLENSAEEEYMKDIEVQAYRGARKVITVDQRLKEYVKEVSGIDATAVRNFIDIHQFKPNKEKKQEYRKKYGLSADDRVLFVPRRLTRKNGVIYPALALPEVLKEFPQTKLIYAGSGEALDELKEIVEENRLNDHVVFLGAIPHEQIKEFYALSDVVLVPSVHSAGVEEATSISALEAMGSGSPLIASAVGGLKEIVNHQEDGLLVEEKNIKELVESIVYLFQHPEKGEEFAAKARQKIESEYSHISAAKKYESVYLKAL
ncbi:glycosyltransferase family 4 protein [Bacillus sp. FSL W8-0102]|uniref:glycosyltransferase family 4 protein n=1 Tax=Bacillus sp. FSL W8-0102 TaxID=2978205 RepID=UPI0030F5AC51